MIKKTYILIVGCGRLGSFLANTLSNDGHSVVVIDLNPDSFDALSTDMFSGFTVEGDATEPAALKQAKIDKADIFIAAAHDENVNIMAAQIAKKRFNVPKIFVRITNPNKESFCNAIGVESICTTSIAAQKIITSLNENINN